MKQTMTDAQVEQEIARLMESEAVRLAKKEMRIKNRRRQYMYGLRNLEKRGKELKDSGRKSILLSENCYFKTTASK